MRTAPAAARALAFLAVGVGVWLPAAAQAPRAPGPPLAATRASPAVPDSIPPPRAPQPAGDRWLAVDKAQHLTFSLLGTLAGQYVLTARAGLSDGRALPVSAGATLALGIFKEVADSRRARAPHFCWRDLTADALGVALGALVVAW